MTDLSPAAQAVLDAFGNANDAQAVLDAFGNANDGEYVDGVWVVNERAMLAAALRAAADQVVPEENVDDAEYHCLQAKWAAEGEQDARMRFLAIADELEAQ